jgi:hypothetical protein
MFRILLLLFPALLLSISCNGDASDETPAWSSSAGVAGERSTVDLADDEAGPQVHLVYAIPADGADRNLDTNGTIATSFAAAQKWLSGETGGRSLRLDTNNGLPDITFFALSRSDSDLQTEGAFLREAIEAEMRAAGFDSSGKVYAVYYDGGSTYACGSGAWPPVIEGNVSVLFLSGTPEGTSIRCGDNGFAGDVDSPGFWEYVVVHEILHTLGLVPRCAPNETFDGHITGPPNDLMYEGEEETDLPRALDPGHDDYYGTDIPGCPDFADSPFLRG